MKGITIIVILSIVWSVISSIIEKRQKAQKEKLKKEGPTLQTNLKTSVKPTPKLQSAPVFTVDPEQIRVEALRRRRAQQQKKQPEPVVEPVKQEKQVVPQKGKYIQGITKLHDEACPVPPTEYTKPKKQSPARQIAVMLQNRRNLRTAIVLSEILQKPVSLR